MPDNVQSAAFDNASNVKTKVKTQAQNSTHAIDPMAAKVDTTIAYTDGACKGNPGAGGWGAHLIFADGRRQDLYGGEPQTTNNRMELMGAIEALKHSPPDIKLEIWTDSSYVKNGITDWIDGWKKRGWKTSGKKPVANQDLWQQLDTLRQDREVEWHWVKGHAGHAGNEKADELANLGVTGTSSVTGTSGIADTSSVAAKKKQSIMSSSAKPNESYKPEESPIKDWLFDDPLGLDMLAEDDDNEADRYNSADNIDYETNNNEHLKEHNPVLLTTGDDNNMSYTEVDNAPITSRDDSNMADNQAELPKFDGDTSRSNPNFEPLLPQPIHRGENGRQLIMDTETTGLDPQKGDRVIEVGIVEMVGRKFTGEKLHVYINPQRGMDEEVIRIHGISEAFLQDKPTFDKVAKALYDFMDGAEIIAHNAAFDMNFLTMEFDKVGLSDFAERVKVTDSLLMAKQQYPGQKNTLDALVRRLDVGKQDRTFHGALLDSEILAEVYLAMTGGQVSLAIEEDAQADGGQTAHSRFADLAALLLTSKSDLSANEQWFAGLAPDYPEIEAQSSKWSYK